MFYDLIIKFADEDDYYKVQALVIKLKNKEEIQEGMQMLLKIKSAEAYYELGLIYSRDSIVVRNIDKSIEYLLLASEKISEANIILADLFMNYKNNIKLSVEYLNKALTIGYEITDSDITDMYEQMISQLESICFKDKNKKYSDEEEEEEVEDDY